MDDGRVSGKVQGYCAMVDSNFQLSLRLVDLFRYTPRHYVLRVCYGGDVAYGANRRGRSFRIAAGLFTYI